MSQAGALNSKGGGTNAEAFAVQTGTSPVVPSGNIVTFNGAVVAAGTHPVRTDGTGASTMALEVQTSQAIASTDATKIGLAAFNSAQFTVDANGFVSSSGTGIGETITGQSGGALSPTAGNWNIYGATTAAGTSPVVTSGSGSTLTVDVQTAQAIASTDATKIGLASFNSANFSVDANGFVTFTGGGSSITLAGDTGSATGSSFTISGGSTGLTTAVTGSTINLTGVLHLADGGTNANLTASNGGIFYSTASAGAILAGTATASQVLLSGSSTTPAWSTATYPATTTINQLLYSSSANVITGLATGNNGVLITSATGVPSILADGTTGQVLTATTGSPPSWSSIVTGVSSVTGTANQILASPTTGAVVLSLIGPYTPATYTAHGVLVGEGTSSIVAISPDATSGIPLISQGSSSDPAYGTAVVAGGGTGDTSFTAYAPICGGTSTTGALQSASTGISTSGYVLTSTGASSLPSFQAIPSSSMTWTDESTSFSAVAGNGYFVTGTAAATLPASPSQGNTISFIVDTANILTITANTGQVIRIGSAVSASAGTAANNARGDSLTLVYRSSDTAWICLGASQGTWTVT